MLNIIVCICLYLCRWSFGADKSRVHKLEELQETVRVTKNAKNDVAAGNCKGYCLVYGCLCSIFLCILYSRDKLPKEDSFSDLQGDRIALLIFFFFISRFIVLHFSDLKDYLSCPSYSYHSILKKEEQSFPKPNFILIRTLVMQLKGYKI